MFSGSFKKIIVQRNNPCVMSCQVPNDSILGLFVTSFDARFVAFSIVV